MSFRYFTALLCILVPSLASGSDKYRLYKSAHFLGRGDTGIAIADDHDAIFYNPAGLAQGTGIYKETVLLSPLIEVSSDTKDLIRQISVEGNSDPETLLSHEGKNQHIGLYDFLGIVLRRAAVGAFVGNQTNILVRKDPDEAGLNMVEANAYGNQGAAFSIAESFFSSSLMVGGTFKYLRRQSAELSMSLAESSNMSDQLEDENNMTQTQGSGADLGLIYRVGTRAPFSLGVHVENVGTTKLTAAEEGSGDDSLPQMIHAGIALEPGTKYSKFRLLLDYRDITNEEETTLYKRIHVGSEIVVGRFLGLSGGLNQGYPTMGLYVNLYFLRFDVGAYSEEVGSRAGARPDKRYYFKLFAGF
ncbi:MAG: hypothetical protein AB7T49_15755 [Oligoflexales bacterium]